MDVGAQLDGLAWGTVKKELRLPGWPDPTYLWEHLAGMEPAYLVERRETYGRRAFLGVRPRLIVRAKDGHVHVASGGHVLLDGAVSIFEVLKRLPGDLSRSEVPSPPFAGGLTGYVGYDAVRQLERLPVRAEDDLQLPDALFLAPGLLIELGEAPFGGAEVRISAHFAAEAGGHARQAAEDELAKAAALLGEAPADGGRSHADATDGAGGSHADAAGGVPTVGISNVTPTRFHNFVRWAKDDIRRGEVLQVVLSQRWAFAQAPPPLATYRQLRALNPSPYQYLLQWDDGALAGASPERLVAVEAGRVRARPIAGTRPRGGSPQDDAALESDLLADDKERSEHVMLVDLGRNDLGRVCAYGTVEVQRLMAVERFSHVMHMVSDLRGRLAAGRSAVDALAACFPAGTLSGAPKVRAMEIIESFEPTRRGPYGGALVGLGANGDLDSCIIIRTAVYRNDTAYVQAGAGIVADSRPEREFAETQAKARAVATALERAAAAARPVREGSVGR